MNASKVVVLLVDYEDEEGERGRVRTQPSEEGFLRHQRKWREMSRGEHHTTD